MFNQRQNPTFFYFLLLLTAYLTYFLVKPYLPVVVFAAVTVVGFLPLYHILSKLLKKRVRLAGILTIIAILLIFLVPTIFILNITIRQTISLSNDLTSFVSKSNVSLNIIIGEVNRLLGEIPFDHGYTLTADQVRSTLENAIQPIVSYLANFAVNIGSSSADLIAKFVIYIVVMAALFPNYEIILQLIKDISPLDDDLDQKYIDRVTLMTKAMLRGFFLIAVAQGLTAGLFFLIAGVKYTTFWTILAIFFSILPMGANIIAIPIGIVMLLFGNIWQGVLIIAGSLLVVSNVDNFLVTMLVPKEARLNSAVVLLGVFGGLQLFGVLGIVYGPVVMIFLLTTIEIYLEHYKLNDKRISKVDELPEENSS